MEQTLINGLRSTPKYIPDWFLYDKEGSEYFSDIIQRNVTEYYFHKSEISILQTKIQEMIPGDLKNVVLVDMGSGNDEKTRLFFDMILQVQSSLTYIPIDASSEFLEDSAKDLNKDYGDRINVCPFTGVYKDGLEFLRSIQHKETVVLWLGGGFQNEPLREQQEYMRLLSAFMTDKCRLIISVDITQDEDAILNAYLGKEVKEFYSNSLHRLNRDYGATLEMDKLRIHGDYVKNDSPQLVSYVRIWAEAKEPIHTDIPGLGMHLSMKKGEKLYVHHGEGISCKYTVKQIENQGMKGGMRLHQHWESEDHHAAIFCFVPITTSQT